MKQKEEEVSRLSLRIRLGLEILSDQRQQERAMKCTCNGPQLSVAGAKRLSESPKLGWGRTRERLQSLLEACAPLTCRAAILAAPSCFAALYSSRWTGAATGLHDKTTKSKGTLKYTTKNVSSAAFLVAASCLSCSSSEICSPLVDDR